MTRETLTPRALVERFADAIGDAFAKPAEVELHAIPVGPVIERSGGKFGAVLAPRDRWRAAHEGSLSIRAT